MIVVTLTTTTLELVGDVEETGTLDELLATTRGLDSARTDDATLCDEGATLNEEVETLWLDELLAWLEAV